MRILVNVLTVCKVLLRNVLHHLIVGLVDFELRFERDTYGFVLYQHSRPPRDDIENARTTAPAIVTAIGHLFITSIWINKNSLKIWFKHIVQFFCRLLLAHVQFFLLATGLRQTAESLGHNLINMTKNSIMMFSLGIAVGAEYCQNFCYESRRDVNIRLIRKNMVY